MDSVAEDRRIFGIKGDWSTAAALDAGVWYNTEWCCHHIQQRMDQRGKVANPARGQ